MTDHKTDDLPPPDPQPGADGPSVSSTVSPVPAEADIPDLRGDPRLDDPTETPDTGADGSAADSSTVSAASAEADVPDLHGDPRLDDPTETPDTGADGPASASPTVFPARSPVEDHVPDLHGDPRLDDPTEAAALPLAPRRDPAPAPRTPLAALLLTGLAAAAIGAGIAFWLDQRAPADLAALQDRLAAQDTALAALSGRLDGLPAAPDLAPLAEDIASLRADLVAATEGLRPALDGLAARLEALERAPSADGTLPDRALAAWAADLDGLRADLADQAARIDAVAAQSAARIDATAAELANIEAQATEAALAAARRGAALQVLAALDAGTPFAEPLAEAAGTGAPPPTLAGLAETGAPTLATLGDTFPEAARAALAAARAEGLTGEAQGTFSAFLRSQFDVRSTTPQAGDSPDAVLSRAEAALRAADLDAALAEIATLPEVLRGAMGDWLTQAQTRQQALAEGRALAETLNAN